MQDQKLTGGSPGLRHLPFSEELNESAEAFLHSLWSRRRAQESHTSTRGEQRNEMLMLTLREGGRRAGVLTDYYWPASLRADDVD